MLLVCFQPVNAESITAIIPVKVTGTDQVTVQITSDDEQAKQALEKSEYVFNGEGEIELNYSTPVDYKYTIKQVSKNDSNVTYDETVYDVNVFVENDDGKLISHVVVWKQGDTQKKEAVEYTNVIKKSNSSKPTDTSDDSNMFIYITEGIVCLCILTLLVITRIKDGKENKE